MVGLALASLLAFARSADADPPPAVRAGRTARPPTAQAPRVARGLPAGYSGAVRAWHAAPTGDKPPLDASGRPLLVIVALNTHDRVSLSARTDVGGFAAADLERAAHVLREPGSGNEHPVEPRLLDLVFRIQAHFAAHEIRVVSGFRTPVRGSHSNHGKGRAIDLVVPRTTDEEVAEFARQTGFVGVGVYPTSGFVHVDVRPRSYFWIDTSGPGRRNRERGVLADLAQKSDAAAAQRGERPIAAYGLAFDVDGALREHRASPPTLPGSPPEEDDPTEGD